MHLSIKMALVTGLMKALQMALSTAVRLVAMMAVTLVQNINYEQRMLEMMGVHDELIEERILEIMRGTNWDEKSTASDKETNNADPSRPMSESQFFSIFIIYDTLSNQYVLSYNNTTMCQKSHSNWTF